MLRQHLQEAGTIKCREHDVTDRQVEFALCGKPESVSAVVCLDGLEVGHGALERHIYEARDVRIVFDDQHASPTRSHANAVQRAPPRG